jgi:glycosyltransferase involved in cell wall biosynthesis
MKKRIVYIGNKLSKHGVTPTSVETLGARLNSDYEVLSYSNKRNFIYRCLEMYWGIIANCSKVDIVLIDTYSTLAFNYAWTCGILCRLLKIPYIPILHGGNLEVRKNSRNNFIFQSYLKNSKVVISPSNFLKSIVEKDSNLKVQVIPNSIEINMYPFEIRNIDNPKILWVRSFHEIYNPEMAIRVMEVLISRGINASMIMVGPDKDGSLEKTKKAAARLNMLDFVTFPGRLELKDWVRLSHECNVFINTTNFDNTPVSLMEAMALGLPVISTNVGGVRFIIDDEINGFLVPADDHLKMAEKILELKNDNIKARQIILDARKKAETWDWNDISNEWKKILEN